MTEREYAGPPVLIDAWAVHNERAPALRLFELRNAHDDVPLPPACCTAELVLQCLHYPDEDSDALDELVLDALLFQSWSIATSIGAR